MNLKIASSFLVFTALMWGCNSESAPPSEPPGDGGPRPVIDTRQVLATLSAADRDVVGSDNGFGFRLFSRLAEEDTQGNLFISPLSVSMALTMAYNGARGETETAIAKVLGHEGMARADVNALYAKLIPALKTGDSTVDVSIANSIWSATGFEAERDFMELNRMALGAETNTLDFTAPTAASVINKWVSDKTQGLIPTLVEPPLDPDLVMMLLNALYFKGDWSTSFNPDHTHDGVFRLSDGTVKTTRMMTADWDFLHFADEDVRALRLPYGDSLFSLTLLQPTDTAGLSGLISSLEAGAWEEWDGKFSVRKGRVYLPKFKLEYKVKMNDVLSALGMSVAFGNGADFSGMSKEISLKISQVVHKTFVEVDEKGTKAAAVTQVDMVPVSMPADLIRLDRPFLAVIHEKSSGTVLFLGRIMDPAP